MIRPMMTLKCSSPRSLPFTIMLSSILVAILLLTSTLLDYSHHDKTTGSVLFVSGFSSSSLPGVKVASYNQRPLKGSQQQSQFNNKYKHQLLWSSSTETTTTEDNSGVTTKVKAVKQKKKSTKKYTKKYKKKGYKKKKSFYKSNFPGKFIYCCVYVNLFSMKDI